MVWYISIVNNAQHKGGKQNDIKKIRYDLYTCGEWRIEATECRIKGLYPKYRVENATQKFYACTLKEARETIACIEKNKMQ